MDVIAAADRAEQPFLGREGDLARLRALAGGRLPAVALVGGPPGVGKTSLVRALAAGWEGPVLLGHGDPLVPQPLGLLREAVAPHASACPGLVEDLGAAGDALVGRGRAGAGGAAAPDQDALLRASIEVLRRAAGTQAALLALEDLHWADGPSTALVSRIVRTGGLPVVVVGTYRPDEAGGPLAALLADLERRAGVHSHHLGGLSRRDVAVLVRSRTGTALSTRQAAALHQRTGGNPLFVEELARAMAGEGADALLERPLPRSAAGAVLARFAAFDDEAVAVAEAAATDSVIDFEVLACLVGGDPTSALRRLVDAGVLTEADPDRFAFRHELIREAVSSRMLARQRRRLHERAYLALRELGRGDEARLARHARLAGRDADVARHALWGAAARLAQGFPLEALALAEQGVAADPEAPLAPRLSQVAAEAARNLGFYADAARHARAARAAARARDDRPGQVAACLLLAEAHGAAGDLGAQRAALGSARDAAGDDASLARCEAAAARALMLEERFEDALAHADRALALARRAGPSQIVAPAEVTRGTALLALPGREHEGLAALEEGRERALADGDTFTVSRALLNCLAGTRPDLDPGRAWAAYGEATAYARRHGLDSIGGNLARVGADLAVAEGDLARAEQILVGRLAEEVDRVEAAAVAAKAGLLALERDDTEAAGALLDRYLPEAERVEQHWARTYLRLLAVAHAARAGGDVEAALDAYAAAVGPAAHALRASRAAEAARWALGAGVPLPAVERFLAQTLCAADQSDCWWRAQLDVARADAAGDDEAVLADCRFASPRLPQWTADTHWRKARAAARLGLDGLAREHVEQALELLARWPGWRREAVQALGPAPPQAIALTARERQVLEQVARGLSNQRIATELGISPRTVAVHVSSILRKTGFASRVEVAAWAIRQERAAPDA